MEKKSTNYGLSKYIKQICAKLLYYLLNTSRLRIITRVISESLATETFTSSHVGDSTEYLKGLTH